MITTCRQTFHPPCEQPVPKYVASFRKRGVSISNGSVTNEHPLVFSNQRVLLLSGCLRQARQDFTRLRVVEWSGTSLPSMMALQVLVIVSASSKLMLKACMWDSLLVLMPQVLSKSKLMVLESDDLRS